MVQKGDGIEEKMKFDGNPTSHAVYDPSVADDGLGLTLLPTSQVTLTIL